MGDSGSTVVLSPAEGDALTFGRIIATGGIGHGIVFALEGNATLGRNESRLGRLQEGRDYCKLHIIAHYIAVLLGAGRRVDVIPIGRVGDDEPGRRLAEEIRATGMRMDEVARVPGAATLYSVCFLYPDKTGGNITTEQSASSSLTPADVDAALARHPTGGVRELVLAAPEVPLETRVRLLERGAARGAFTVASVLASEAEAFAAAGGFRVTDLLAVNIDEARAIGGVADSRADAARIVAACAERLWREKPGMLVAVTDGGDGCYACQEGRVGFIPALRVSPVATGGAGDAFLAGVVCGL
ncbi:MAG TPA: PfkB family carbohydrate kinase, partial [Spirochaetia bacterium]